VLRIIKGKRFNSIYYDAYNLLGITLWTGEFENGIIYHNKALAVIDDDIIYPNFNLGQLLTITLVFYDKNVTVTSKGLDQKNLSIQNLMYMLYY
jgi:hypothetical protein